MLALLLAAAVAAVHPGQPSDPGGLLTPPITTFVGKGAETPACAKLLTQTVAPDGTPFRRLDQLPDKIEEHAVWRMVGGCPVREVVWNGQTYYVGSNNPVLDSGPLTGDRLRRYDSTPDNRAPSPSQY